MKKNQLDSDTESVKTKKATAAAIAKENDTDGEDDVKSKSKRPHDRGAFARFEAKYHLIGNVVAAALIIVLALMCAFSTVQISMPAADSDEGIVVEQSMIDLGKSVTGLFMSAEDQNAFVAEYEVNIGTIMLDAYAKHGDDEKALAGYIGDELSKTEYAKYMLIKSKNNLTVDADSLPEGSEAASLIRTLERYFSFGTVVLGIASCVPMALAVLSAAILLIKALFLLLFMRNGKNLHIAFPLMNTFVILAMVMMNLGAGFHPGIFIYAIFGASFIGMLLAGIIRYVTYPNKFMGRGLARYIVMQAGMVVALCMSLLDTLIVKMGDVSVSMSVGELVNSGLITSHLSGGFDTSTWVMPLALDVIMLLATFIMGCIMASKMFTVGNRWRKRQWKARNELTAISAILVTGFMAGFGYLYTFIYNNYIHAIEGLKLELNWMVLIAPVVLLLVFIFLLILRPAKRQRSGDDD